MTRVQAASPVVDHESREAHSCVLVILRYLESCNVPITMKRKCQSSSNTASSNSDDCRQKGSSRTQVSEGTLPPRLQQLFGARDLTDGLRVTGPTTVAPESLVCVLLGSTCLAEGSVWSLIFGRSRQKAQRGSYSDSGDLTASSCPQQTRERGLHNQPV